MHELLRLRANALVVFEGLDRAGKSTQLEHLRRIGWATPRPTFVHMPSGLSSLTREVYRLTESEPIGSAVCRQLLHLACHAENIRHLVEARAAGGVILDRWWWSTVAYGWSTGDLQAEGVDADTFLGLVRAIWSRLQADLVLTFLNPYEADSLNTDAVAGGYRRLADENAEVAVLVPSAEPGVVADFVITTLRARRLVQSI